MNLLQPSISHQYTMNCSIIDLPMMPEDSIQMQLAAS